MQYDRLTATTADSVGPDTAGRHAREHENSDAVLPAALIAENIALRSELNAVELERAKLGDAQRRIMELLGTTSPDRLVHDVRNLLNERALLKALVDVVD